MSRHELEEELRDLHERAMEQVKQIAPEVPDSRRTAALKKVRGWLKADTPPPKLA